MNKVIASLILVLMTAPLGAQVPADVPKLVVGITIDQLRTDYLQMMRHVFGDKGFKRLMDEGLLYDQVTFDFPNIDRSSATASIYTGTYPAYNGIVANTLYNVAEDRVESILYDPAKMGNYTNETVSPKNLLTSTICDELKIATEGVSRVFSVAPTFEQAILSGGHAANAVFWIDNDNGKWASSTHYKDIPAYIDQYNIESGLDRRIDTIVWQPLRSATDYTGLSYLSSDYMFKHIFDKGKYKKYDYFKTSGLVNEEVNRVVEAFLTKGELGKQMYPDMLNIGYSAANYQGKSIQEYSLEIQDTYLRLDQEIARLLEMIDKNVGLKNTVIFLTSTGYFNGEAKEVGIYEIPAGEFYPERATSLLNMYLMAVYGQEKWVLGYHDRQIFLNRKLISDKEMSLKDVQLKAAEFLVQMTGIQDVTTSFQMLHGNWNNRIDAIRRGYHRKLSGDLLLEVQPGWEIVYENTDNPREYVRENAIPAPLIFFGKDIKPQHIARPVRVTMIAPTVSRILRIRSPNAASQPALPEIR